MSTSSPTVQPRISILEMMTSVCSGAVLTSLILTPLDVVRVRLQQQEIIMPDSKCCKRKVFWEVPKARPVSTLPTGPIVNGAASCVHDVCFTEFKKTNGTLKTILSISKNEGVTTLWRGLSLALLMSIPSSIVYFTCYELLREQVKFSNPIFEPLLCGSLARVFSGTAVSPFELLKTRLQSIPNSNSNVMKSLFTDLQTEVKSKGPKVLYKGLGLTLWRDVPFSGIYWASYDPLRPLIASMIPSESLFVSSFLTGSISGTLAAIFTNPFDVGKTRLQISSDTQKGGKEKSVVKLMWDIYKFEGFGAFYVGVIPRCLKIAPSCAIMISCYELGKKFFQDKNNDTSEEGIVSEGVLQ